ncbi:hypothetical protein DU490_02130 [Halomonas sp. DQ26W]|uniref:nucleotidyltransferase family protein n=1 Tax=Halomonas sp. DQ26W TaxID=2282311 RepID=UPI000DF74B28|nr:nucleotidyltransferase family protein [Halomonas sp. DQ26W]RDB44391.1 hypothetical protein DU490_02130 [Halomonas sp. DQ26W]
MEERYMSLAQRHMSLTLELKLLLLLSRLELSESQAQQVRDLIERIPDWALLADEARRRFILPLAHRHLRSLATQGEVPEAQWEVMRRGSLDVIRHNLLIAAEQRRLVEHFLNPSSVPHLFFKGPSLAGRYYDDPAVRFCRDIDLLVPAEHVFDLLDAMLAEGYVSWMPKGLSRERAGLAFACRTHQVISLISPLGIPVEVHRQIDRSGNFYNTWQLIDGKEVFRLDGMDLAVMPIAELFVYLCLHHCRHHWSHLHWLVDLDALQRHPDFDLAAVEQCAERRGLSATLAACLELHRALKSPEPWQDELSANGHDLVRDSLLALQGGRDTEFALSRTLASPDLAYGWQASLRHRLRGRRLHNVVKFFLPDYADYRHHPLPPRWQWIYHLTTPFQKTYSRITTGRWRQ